MRSPLPGRPNVYNILAATAVAVGLDLPQRAIQQGIARVTHVPGRFQRVSAADADVFVLVDYAHTDDALKNVLETVRPMAQGRLITVFGCGGERDRSKRPLMGAVAARLSDLVVLTSDNPRSEDPGEIIEDIKRGIVPPGDRPAMHQGQVLPPIPVTPLLAIVDRAAAIERAVREAQPGDTVLIAGKGHEKYQVIGDKSLPFDDVEVAQRGAGAPARWDGARDACRCPAAGDVARATGRRGWSRGDAGAPVRSVRHRFARGRAGPAVLRDSRRAARRPRFASQAIGRRRGAVWS